MAKFECLKCGNCCKNRFVCIYYSELDKFNNVKSKANKPFQLIPFRYYIDLTNRLIINVIYRADTKPCPFLNNNLCNIEEEKFLSCRKFPIATWLDLGFLSILGINRLHFELDENCSFLKERKVADNFNLKKNFSQEIEATYQDYKIWTSISSTLTKIKKEKEFNVIIDYKIRRKYKKRLSIILDKWENIPVNVYIKNYK